jgi:enamine deaminase RidA (YjgF/YER057c/UK114 family)
VHDTLLLLRNPLLLLTMLRNPTMTRAGRQFARGVKTEAQIAKMGLTLPSLPQPAGAYQLAVKQGSFVTTAGHLPFKEDMKTPIPGIVGKDFTTAQGAELAKLTALELVSSLKVAVGDLDRVRRIVKLNGYIACAPDFTEHPEVLNGASNLLGEIFGDRGVHARAAVGVTSLPRGVPVEIDLVVEIDPFGFPDKSN